jgi:hypothetical protein
VTSSSSDSRAQTDGALGQNQQQQLPVSTPAVCLREPLTIQGGPTGPSAVGVKRAPPPGLWTSHNGSQLLEPEHHRSALIPTPTAQQAGQLRAPWEGGSSPSRFQRTAVTPPEYLTPDSLEDEEEQLRRALALSLQEASAAAGGPATSNSPGAAAGDGEGGGGTSTRSSSHHSSQGSVPSGAQRPPSARAAQQHNSPLAAGALGHLLSRSRLGGSAGSAGGSGGGAGGSGPPAPAQRGSEYEVTMRREAVSAGGLPPANMVDLLCQELGDGLVVTQQQEH